MSGTRPYDYNGVPILLIHGTTSRRCSDIEPALQQVVQCFWLSVAFASQW
jgi:hypothetical protein